MAHIFSQKDLLSRLFATMYVILFLPLQTLAEQ